MKASTMKYLNSMALKREKSGFIAIPGYSCEKRFKFVSWHNNLRRPVFVTIMRRFVVCTASISTDEGDSQRKTDYI